MHACYVCYPPPCGHVSSAARTIGASRRGAWDTRHDHTVRRHDLLRLLLFKQNYNKIERTDKRLKKKQKRNENTKEIEQETKWL